MLCVTKTTEYMKKYLKAIGCFAIFVLAVFLYFREQPYKLDSLSLQNVEALAEGEADAKENGWHTIEDLERVLGNA